MPSTERPSTNPDVKRGAKGRWLPGQSPNPSGQTKAMREIQQMLDREHRTVENMREVFKRLKALAMGEVVHIVDKDGEVDIELKADPAFMRMYLERIMGPVKDIAAEDFDDLVRGWPDELVQKLAEAGVRRAS